MSFDPAGLLDAHVFVAWKLSCLRAIQDGADPPPMPCRPQSEAAAEGEVGDPYGSDVLHWIVEQLEGIEHAQEG